MMDIIEQALQQVGYVEGTNNNNKFGKFYNQNYQPWCMYFVQWIFEHCNQKLDYFSGSCSAVLNWYKQHAASKVSQSPKAGDIVIYPWGHTGIVIFKWYNKICTVEGNTSPDSSGSQNNGGGVYVRNRSITGNEWFISVAVPNTTITKEETIMQYENIEEVPAWYRPTIEKLISMSVLNSWPISEDMCRIFTVMDRLGLIGGKE